MITATRYGPCGRRGLADPSRQSGVTLIEVTIYFVLLVVVGSQIVQIVRMSSRSFAESDAVGKTQERNRVAIQRLLRDVRGSLGDRLNVSNSGRTLTAVQAGVFSAGALQPGEEIRWEMTIAPGEKEDGVDNDGNGLVDEGALRRTNVTSGESHWVCGGLDLSACEFRLDDRTVTALLTHWGSTRRGEAPVRLSRVVLASPRN